MGKVIVTGGGIAGLAAGIYARKFGFECEIYERHAIAGGQCTGWERKGCVIDNCIHWMTGTSPRKELYRVWEEVGALGDGVEVIQQDKFLSVKSGGKTVSVWKDVDRLEKELLAFAPEDAREIKRFARILRAFHHMEIPARKPSEQMGFWDNMRYVAKILPVIPHAAKYNNVSITEYVSRFKNETVRLLVSSYLPETYNAVSLFYMLGTFMSGNGALPRGGSLGVADRMKDRFLSLGGKIHTGKAVVSATIEDGAIRSLTLKNGETVAGDRFIFACDAIATFGILGEEYMPGFFAKRYNDAETFPTFSTLNIYFRTSAKSASLSDTVLFKCAPIDILGRKQTKICMKNFDYEPSFAPEGESVYQVMVLQDDSDFQNWARLHSDKEAYRQAKQDIACRVLAQVAKEFPELENRMEVVEIVTPYSFHRFLGAYHGAYMSWVNTARTPRELHDGRISGISNAIVSGQWTMPPGGLPNAVLSGKFAAQRVAALG